MLRGGGWTDGGLLPIYSENEKTGASDIQTLKTFVAVKCDWQNSGASFVFHKKLLVLPLTPGCFIQLLCNE